MTEVTPPTTPPIADLQQERLNRRRHIIKSYKARADAKRNAKERFADLMTDRFGTIVFLLFNLVVFAVWFLINLDWFPVIHPFDPFPYGLLTMGLSIEAIVLAIVVLISQNRAARVSELREEIDLQVNMVCEEEITKILHLLSKIADKQDIDLSADHELESMLKPLQSIHLEDRLEKQLS